MGGLNWIWMTGSSGILQNCCCCWMMMMMIFAFQYYDIALLDILYGYVSGSTTNSIVVVIL